jgi:hypothetical protein
VWAAIALEDGQAEHGRAPWWWEQAWLAGRVSPRPLEHRLQGGLAEGEGRRGWVGAMAGAEVGEQDGGGNGVLAAGRCADPEVVGRVTRVERGEGREGKGRGGGV